jgi:hypothetical protein
VLLIEVFVLIFNDDLLKDLMSACPVRWRLLRLFNHLWFLGIRHPIEIDLVGVLVFKGPKAAT